MRDFKVRVYNAPAPNILSSFRNNSSTSMQCVIWSSLHIAGPRPQHSKLFPKCLPDELQHKWFSCTNISENISWS